MCVRAVFAAEFCVNAARFHRCVLFRTKRAAAIRWTQNSEANLLMWRLLQLPANPMSQSYNYRPAGLLVHAVLSDEIVAPCTARVAARSSAENTLSIIAALPLAVSLDAKITLLLLQLIPLPSLQPRAIQCSWIESSWSCLRYTS